MCFSIASRVCLQLSRIEVLSSRLLTFLRRWVQTDMGNAGAIQNGFEKADTPIDISVAGLVDKVRDPKTRIPHFIVNIDFQRSTEQRETTRVESLLLGTIRHWIGKAYKTSYSVMRTD